MLEVSRSRLGATGSIGVSLSMHSVGTLLLLLHAYRRKGYDEPIVVGRRDSK